MREFGQWFNNRNIDDKKEENDQEQTLTDTSNCITELPRTATVPTVYENKETVKQLSSRWVKDIVTSVPVEDVFDISNVVYNPKGGEPCYFTLPSNFPFENIEQILKLGWEILKKQETKEHILNKYGTIIEDNIPNQDDLDGFIRIGSDHE